MGHEFLAQATRSLAPRIFGELFFEQIQAASIPVKSNVFALVHQSMDVRNNKAPALLFEQPQSR